MTVEKRLTPKQQRFVNAYLATAHGNATEAARIAGYKEQSYRRLAAAAKCCDPRADR